MPKRARAEQRKADRRSYRTRAPICTRSSSGSSTNSKSDRRSRFRSMANPRATSEAFSPRPRQAPRLAQSDDMLVKAIQAVLYDRCYARRPLVATRHRPRSPISNSGGGSPRPMPAASVGTEAGSSISSAPTGRRSCARATANASLFPGAFIFDAAPGMTPQIGSSVSVRAPSETYEAQPGYYFAFGESLDELADNLSLTRLYFHCRAEDAASLVSELTAALNRFQTPFQLKTPTAPALYGRTDAAVLYVGARYFPITARIVAFVREKVRLEASDPALH